MSFFKNASNVSIGRSTSIVFTTPPGISTIISQSDSETTIEQRWAGSPPVVLSVRDGDISQHVYQHDAHPQYGTQAAGDRHREEELPAGTSSRPAASERRSGLNTPDEVPRPKQEPLLRGQTVAQKKISRHEDSLGENLTDETPKGAYDSGDSPYGWDQPDQAPTDA